MATAKKNVKGTQRRVAMTRRICPSCGQTYHVRVLRERRARWCWECCDTWQACFRAALTGLAMRDNDATPVAIAIEAEALADMAAHTQRSVLFGADKRPVRRARATATTTRAKK